MYRDPRVSGNVGRCGGGSVFLCDPHHGSTDCRDDGHGQDDGCGQCSLLRDSKDADVLCCDDETDEDEHSPESVVYASSVGICVDLIP